MLNISSWRVWPHWLIFSGGLIYATIYAGIIPASSIVAWFVERPEVAQAFRDPNFGRADALILMFSVLFLGPLALFIALIAVIFVLAVLGGFLLPVMRWFNLPDWTATVVAFAGVAGLAWTYSAVWMPPSIWIIGLFARACLAVFA